MLVPFTHDVQLLLQSVCRCHKLHLSLLMLLLLLLLHAFHRS
jgi:hypothetical protein